MAASDLDRAVAHRAPIAFNGLKDKKNVVFFGKSLGSMCQRCGAYNQTSTGHKFCGFVACPIALLEFKRRQRKRTSSFEKVYLPKILLALRDPQGPTPIRVSE